MTDQEAKETLNKSEIVRLAEASIRDMTIKLSKFKGEKTEQEKHLFNLRNLLNLAVKQGYDLDRKQNQLGNYLVIIGDYQRKLEEMTQMHAISEKIHEVGINEVVSEFEEKTKKLFAV